MQFADIVIESSRADQVHIGLDRPRALLCQTTDHQRVLEGAGGFGGEPAQQRSLQIGQLHQPCPGEQAEEALHQRGQQQAAHQQSAHEHGLTEEIAISGHGDPCRCPPAQMQQGNLKQQRPEGQEHR